jgi:murein DD-endopeptidase MepM/ murein hydrolase activator NlpD
LAPQTGRITRRLSGLLFFVVLILSPCVLARRMEPDFPITAARLEARLPDPLKILNGTIGRNTTLAAALDDMIPRQTVHAVVEAARPLYDLARVSVGHPFGLTLEADGVLKAFTYGIDEVRTLRVVREGGTLKADLLTRPYEMQVRTLSGVIESSLFGAVEDAGGQDQVALDMADIFECHLDFNTEVRRGDSFRVAVEALNVEGRFVRYGKILAAEFVNDGRTLRAVRFAGSGGDAYYSPDGTPTRRAFLRSPLKFSRISSGFTTKRFHPVLGIFRPHLGVDLAAPTGTPVNSIGDGVVTAAGWSGGFGQTVQIHHPNGYDTLYGHLSAILVRRGQRVTQGSPIGRVGMTGLATGPHLDYRMQRHGVFVDPMKIVSPPAEPVSASERPQFDQVAARALRLLEDARGPDAVRAADATRVR